MSESERNADALWHLIMGLQGDLEHIVQRAVDSEDFSDSTYQRVERWLDRAVRALGQFAPDEAARLRRVEPLPKFMGDKQGNLRNHVKPYLEALLALSDDVLQYPEHFAPPTTVATSSMTAQADTPRNSREVFVVHGRDEAAKESVARFLEKLDLKVVILHERANRGRTLIEKFEAHADVAFAVVLLTPDDVGYPSESPDEAKPRARQNVIFELGYFMAKLERKRVCALLKGGMEKPSDIDGIVWVRMDGSAGWRLQLARELEAAEITIDWSRVA